MSIRSAAIKVAQEFHKNVTGQENDYAGANAKLDIEIIEELNREYRRGFEAGKVEGRLAERDKDFDRLMGIPQTVVIQES
jgi:hypothetical protein